MRVGEWLSDQDELPTGVHPDDLGTVVQAAALAMTLVTRLLGTVVKKPFEIFGKANWVNNA